MLSLRSVFFYFCCVFFVLSFKAQARTAPYCFQLVEAPEKRRSNPWTKESLVQVYTELVRLGFKLYPVDLRSGRNLDLEAAIKKILGPKVSGLSIYKAAIYKFGTWENLLKTIGEDPQKHAFMLEGNPDELIALLLHLNEKIGEKIRPFDSFQFRVHGDAFVQDYTLQRFGRKIKVAAVIKMVLDHFQTWEKALIAAGLPTPSAAPPINWTATIVTKALQVALQVLKEARFDLSIEESFIGNNPDILKRLEKDLKIRTTGKELHDQAVYFFGSWEAALVAASLNPSQIRMDSAELVWMDREDFFQAMSAFDRSYIPLNYEILASERLPSVRRILMDSLSFSVSGPAIAHFGVHSFGSWPQARRWYLLRKQQSNLFTWSPERIEQWILHFRLLNLNVDKADFANDPTGEFSYAMSLATSRIILSTELFHADKAFARTSNPELYQRPWRVKRPVLKTGQVTDTVLSRFTASASVSKEDKALLAALQETLLENKRMNESLALLKISEKLDRKIPAHELHDLFRKIHTYANERK